MYKTFIAGITAISLTLSTAAPAQANGLNNEDIGKFLFGLIAAGVAVNIVKNNQDRNVRAPAPAPAPQVQTFNPRRSLGHQLQDSQAAKILPRNCLRNVDTRFGKIRMFQRDCMRNNYRFVSSLPRGCKVRALSNNGPRNGWDPQCLRQQGYRANRR